MVVLMRIRWATTVWMASACLLTTAGCAGRGTRDAGTEGTREFRISAERFDFTPSEIRVRQGDRVRLIFTSRDTTHGVSIAEYEVRRDIPPRGRGETVVEFIADKPGTFVYRCSHLCGAGHAMMRGTLVVDPSPAS